MSRYDDFDHLTQELEMEKRYRCVQKKIFIFYFR